MATKKDLVEAHSFSRRRLITAFVSGAPGGREVEPVKPGRIIIGGVALSVLLLAGAAIAGFLIGRPPAAWLEASSFIISKDTGEQYVVIEGGEDPMLQRVPNYVSAQLLLGQAELTPFTVRDKYIRQVRLGDDLGIEGAPAGLPDATDLVDDGWTACTGAGLGVKVSVQPEPEAQELRDSAFLVTSRGKLWLIASSGGVGSEPGRSYRFEMPQQDAQAGTVANNLGFGAVANAPEVSPGWLNLFPLGPALDFSEFGVDRAGQRVDYTAQDSTDLSGFRIGDLLEDPTGRFYLVGDEAPEVLDPFAALVYDAVGQRARPVDDVRWAFPDPSYPAEWPAERPRAVAGGALCAVLHPGVGTQQPIVSLGTDPTGSADPAELPEGSKDVDVAPSSGAYVLSSGDAASGGGSPYVIDTKGSRYALVGPEVPGFIGYGDVEPPTVPSAWLKYFESGVPLSTNAARRVPADAPDETGSDEADSPS